MPSESNLMLHRSFNYTQDGSKSILSMLAYQLARVSALDGLERLVSRAVRYPQISIIAFSQPAQSDV